MEGRKDMDAKMTDVINHIIKSYDLRGSVKEFSPCVNGHINDTYRVVLAEDGNAGREYIFQRINSYVFKEPEKVMHNIHEIARHVQSKKAMTDCDIISFLTNGDGKNYICIDGEYWRVCYAVENSVTYDFVESSEVLYSAGYAFGRFQSMLSDLPMDRLYETIPDFHNTRKRLDDLFDIVALDPEGRASQIREDIAFFEKHRDLACRLCAMLERGELPLRVTHNDTKYNNILMDRDTFEPLCVIDLDTVMPGLSMVDFGDAVRFAANTAMEDETNLDKVGLNLEHYAQFTRGFMGASKGSFTQREVDNMALGAIVITIELASRFLADHINGDKYFRIHRRNHNLDRARCQIKLAADMMRRYDEMCAIVRDTLLDGENCAAVVRPFGSLRQSLAVNS